MVLVLVAFATVSIGACSPRSPTRFDYTLGAVQRGDIESIVLTTGTLAPLNTVVVGSELSGRISELHADFNDAVTEGQLIARIDPRTFIERVEHARAAVAVAQATIAQKSAERDRAVAEQQEAQRELDRARDLVGKGNVSDSEIDARSTALAIATAQVGVASSAIENARALHTQQLAALKLAELDLERTFIRSPVSGTVIKRNVEVGQTVAASLQAPELFQIAQDLRRMKVEASIDEVDIGQIEVGMDCRFTVDAYPYRAFAGQVEQVRKAPDVVFNVVTYKVIITADNEDLALLPGMTSSVMIVTGRRKSVLRVPNASLRFVPPEEWSTPAAAVVGGPPRTVWRLAGGEPQAVLVATGLSDEQYTEIVSGLAEADTVVLRARRREQ